MSDNTRRQRYDSCWSCRWLSLHSPDLHRRFSRGCQQLSHQCLMSQRQGDWHSDAISHDHQNVTISTRCEVRRASRVPSGGDRRPGGSRSRLIQNFCKGRLLFLLSDLLQRKPYTNLRNPKQGNRVRHLYQQSERRQSGVNRRLAQADDHLRLIKSTVKATFPNLTGAVTATHTELNTSTVPSKSPEFENPISKCSSADFGSTGWTKITTPTTR